jgi:hypothetical protein
MKKEDVDINGNEELAQVETRDSVLTGLGWKNILFLTFLVVAVVGILGTTYYYRQYQALKNNPNIVAQKETERLVALLGKIIELPKNETPTIATISDKEKLKDQPFFSTAENGDILFAYNTAMKAILYRPSINKIINVAPITINQPQDVTQGVKKTTPVPAVNNNP